MSESAEQTLDIVSTEFPPYTPEAENADEEDVSEEENGEIDDVGRGRTGTILAES